MSRLTEFRCPECNEAFSHRDGCSFLEPIAYEGVRISADSHGGTRPERAVVERVNAKGERSPLTHYAHHSPDGFEWGYGGSGPSDLALALLADALGPEPDTVRIWKGAQVGRRAWHLHQPFRDAYVAGFGESWRMTNIEIREWAAAYEKQGRAEGRIY